MGGWQSAKIAKYGGERGKNLERKLHSPWRVENQLDLSAGFVKGPQQQTKDRLSLAGNGGHLMSQGIQDVLEKAYSIIQKPLRWTG